MYLVKVKINPAIDCRRNRMRQWMDGMISINSLRLCRPDGGWTPEADIYESRRELIMIIGLPGVRKENIEISLCTGYIHIAGHRDFKRLRELAPRVHQLEIEYGSFERVLQIPVPIHPDQTEALYEDGVLTIRMIKAQKPSSVRFELKS
jgi:HSP20 family protein